MKKLVIIDINNFIYRAYFGIQQKLTAPDGTPVNAVFGVFNMIYKLLDALKPSHVVVAQDSKKSLRKEIYPDYKKSRTHMPEELYQQVKRIYEMLEFMGLQLIESDGYEADDIIYSLVKQNISEFDEIYIASSDKDLMQLVDEKVKSIDTMKDKIYGPKEVEEKLGVKPNQVVDFLALLGDSSDNIPGVKGIGEKTATKLLKEHGSLKGLYDNIQKLPEGKVKQNLILEKSIAELSYDLALLKDIQGLEPVRPFNKETKPELILFFEKLNMKSAVTKLRK